MSRPSKRRPNKKKLAPGKTLQGVSAFQDALGRVSVWPSARRRTAQIAVLEHLATYFEGGRVYTDGEVTALLRVRSTLDDLPLLKRELIASDYLTHDAQAGTYWRSNGRPTAAVRAAAPTEPQDG
ncbi:DUF2087 domain-containing protein [Deinococcus sp. KNUC1210]|uniref:DUF2087 domain-containing protein n=1 Tax=Deinococcus sp. KNUC1210 TaxID=2917691 RepID=UPI001EEFA97C|nr:DUF2087 domain-containing protein [Deinococcus sp. KNUC1210]ULH15031.1 DUF2087 domain-containing protein [Deinococcus sp. KNUC1210]